MAAAGVDAAVLLVRDVAEPVAVAHPRKATLRRMVRRRLRPHVAVARRRPAARGPAALDVAEQCRLPRVRAARHRAAVLPTGQATAPFNLAS